MYNISADIKNNRLYITLIGQVSDSEIKEAVFKTLFELNKLRPGFDIVKNLKDVKLYSENARISFSRAFEIANSYGLSRVINLSEDSEGYEQILA